MVLLEKSILFQGSRGGQHFPGGGVQLFPGGVHRNPYSLLFSRGGPDPLSGSVHANDPGGHFDRAVKGDGNPDDYYVLYERYQ